MTGLQWIAAWAWLLSVFVALIAIRSVNRGYTADAVGFGFGAAVLAMGGFWLFVVPA